MPQTYTVKSGDTLSGIASKYGVDTKSITGFKSGNPNLIYPNEVLNIGGGGNNSIAATDIKPAANLALPTQGSKTASSGFSGDSVNTQVDKYRNELEKTINNRKSEIDTKIKELQKQETDTLGNINTLTQPFRQTLEDTERERLHINQNFEDNQKLVNELDTLLTEGNDLIKQQEGVTGLSAVRNPRIQQTMNDVRARTGVIEAVINARNGQISVAENMIDRSINAIAADRQDQLSYYQTVLNLNNQKLLSLDAESIKMADAQVGLIKEDLDRAQVTADYIKKLLVDPATASLLGAAGVSLNDSVKDINRKLTTAQTNKDIVDFSNNIALQGGVAVVNPTGVEAGKLIAYTDANGGKHYYKLAPTKGTGSASASDPILPATDPSVKAWVDGINSGAITIAQVPADLKNSVMIALNTPILTFEQYLQAAQETSSVSFNPTARAELQQQYTALIGQSKTDSGNTVEDWEASIQSGIETIKDAPVEMQEELRRRIANKINSTAKLVE